MGNPQLGDSNHPVRAITLGSKQSWLTLFFVSVRRYGGLLIQIVSTPKSVLFPLKRFSQGNNSNCLRKGF